MITCENTIVLGIVCKIQIYKMCYRIKKAFDIHMHQFQNTTLVFADYYSSVWRACVRACACAPIVCMFVREGVCARVYVRGGVWVYVCAC